MRWSVLTLAGLLVTAGCLAGGADQAGAKDQLSTAEEQADEKLTDPTLVEVWGIEPLHRSADQDHELVVNADGNPGDGNAPAWGYRFADDQAQMTVIVASGIGVLAHHWENETAEDATPIERWEVDADEAADQLEDNETWPGVQENQTVGWNLEMRNGTPIWDVVVHQGVFGWGDPVVTAEVDAETGEVLAVHEGRWAHDHGGYDPGYDGNHSSGYGASYGPGFGQCDQDEDRGNLATGQEPLQAEVTLPEPGRIQLDIDHGTLVGQATITLAQDGEEIWQETIPETPGVERGSFSETFEDVAPGTYTATLGPADSASVGHDEELELTAIWDDGECLDIDVGMGQSPSQPQASTGHGPFQDLDPVGGQT